MAWSSHILSSGSRDRNILQRDVRAPEDYIHKLVGHRSEVRAQNQAVKAPSSFFGRYLLIITFEARRVCLK